MRFVVGAIMTTRCRSLENLHYLDSWNRHCGGEPWEFISRSLGLIGSGALGIAGITAIGTAGPIGVVFGGALIGKSSNDVFEAWTGKKGIARHLIGDPVYDGIDWALIGYGWFRKIPKINYLGNPKRDFFTKDPLTYERAFRQYSTIELLYEGTNLLVNANNNYDKYLADVEVELVWDKHIRGLDEWND